MSSRSLAFLRVGAISFMMQRIPKNTPQFTVEWSMRPQECNFPASIGTLCCALTLPVWILSVANLARIDGSVLTPQSSEIAEALITFPRCLSFSTSFYEQIPKP